MHFGFSVLYILVVAAGAAVVELAARGLRWLGVGDFAYDLLSGAAHLMLLMDVTLLILVLYYSARKLLRRVANETDEEPGFVKRMFRESLRRYFAPLTGAIRGARRAIRAELRRDDRELERWRRR